MPGVFFMISTCLYGGQFIALNKTNGWRAARAPSMRVIRCVNVGPRTAYEYVSTQTLRLPKPPVGTLTELPLQSDLKGNTGDAGH